MVADGEGEITGSDFKVTNIQGSWGIMYADNDIAKNNDRNNTREQDTESEVKSSRNEAALWPKSVDNSNADKSHIAKGTLYAKTWWTHIIPLSV